MRFFALLLLILVSACGSPSVAVRSQLSSAASAAKIRDKALLYLQLSKDVQDAEGFISPEACDSLLFTGLYGAAGGEVNIIAAKDGAHKWHRRALIHEECYPAFSESEISRDMFMGLLWYIWSNKRLDLATELFDYGASNNWVMGEGVLSRTIFTPGLQATLAEMIYRLGGENMIVVRSIPQSYSKNTGFASHLDALHILLRADMTGSISAGGMSVAKYNYRRVPQNPLFAFIYHRYTDGDQTETQNLLLNEALFPDNRLPTTHDRCEAWILQRDGGADWEPCGLDVAPVLHSGGDFLFVAYLLGKA